MSVHLRAVTSAGVYIGQNNDPVGSVNPVISGVTGHNALGTMVIAGTFTLPITSVTVDGVAYAVTGTPTTIEVQATVPKGGIEMGAAVDLVVTDSIGASDPFSTVMSPPIGSSFVIMSVDYASLPATSILFLAGPSISDMVIGDMVVYANESGGETIVLNTLGEIAAVMAAGDYSTNVYLLDASDSYAAGITGTVSFSIAVEGPDAFSFDAVFGAELSTVTESSIETITGNGTGFAISSGGADYRIDGGTYVTAAGTINPGQTVQMRQTSSGSFSTTVTVTLTIDTEESDFNVTTKPDPSATAPGGTGLSLRLGLGL